MPLLPALTNFRDRLAALPVATFSAGDFVFAAGSKTGRLLILKNGSVAVIKDGLEIAKVTEPGAVFGEMSVLLDQPNTADVRALERSQFHAAEPAALFDQDPVALLYVAAVLAHRLDTANGALLDLKNLIQTGQPVSVISKTIQKMQSVLGASGASLTYAGYPYDPNT
jgi:CRP-like cAMP-binding protein